MQHQPGPCVKCGGQTEFAFLDWHCKVNCVDLHAKVQTQVELDGVQALEMLKAGIAVRVALCVCFAPTRTGSDCGREFYLYEGVFYSRTANNTPWRADKNGPSDRAWINSWATHRFVTIEQTVV